MTEKTNKLFDKITRIGNRAVKKAQEENRLKGIPNFILLMEKLFLNFLTVSLQQNISFKLFLMDFVCRNSQKYFRLLNID